MCLAVPSKVIEIKNSVAVVDVDGVRRDASLMLLDDVKLGDYVIVHAGFAISKIDEDAAHQTIQDMRDMLKFADNNIMTLDNVNPTVTDPNPDANY
ncbi:MAG: HypC/HybG/HupF family hydrogenase formation chaperone [Desulfamplus sp.]|nr:HypC/HybG/HupF family hydrogenase formation chaperone [Desulfamplus sp.]MBF0411599.1 HypC/HybG/HupF family hydrogenase formation chaperone [Desulfamplus sp.]